ncbi:uncharacterized protein LOC123511907 isoform X2 [Portunus trituberculatus]|uniref:uncharacterized protein LOC123511907 isoform X2 n=1 Tax=Portunus trituberculatus TaxID=210409 RepID=UPI001E1CD6B9|nr:uncharacterized protein LOC123511907 isoform X2 [Portunus trituberculatus]
MLTTLVLIKSYSGNLMSLLAVKYLPQPFQSLQDVIDHRSVSIIWQKSSLFEQYIRTAKSGVFHEMARLEKEGRMVFHKQPQFPWSLDTFVRRGRHVLADADITITNLIARDYSATGRCDFYLSRDGFFPYSSSLISHKTDPLIQSIDKWVLPLIETGLVRYWMESVPNYTICDSPSKIKVHNEPFSSSHIWIVYVLLGLGLGAGAVVLLLEIVTHRLT